MPCNSDLFEGEFTGQVVINTTHTDGFVDRFIAKHAGYIFQTRFQIGSHEYLVFEINETQRTSKISTETEDPDIANLKLDSEVDFVKQEKDIPEYQRLQTQSGQICGTWQIVLTKTQMWTQTTVMTIKARMEIRHQMMIATDSGTEMTGCVKFQV
ncbi:unnamed protein product [Mytilus edulis]|uniref:Uncharacterized protein n=1 Tax=Mytilus edulis TaxID=6550 RepID=A0A8S3QH50_MYTED|nr:unnamed protein product [Mytilus edulis]